MNYNRNRESSVNVLMLGWELPPRITGGLGVACQGLLEALSTEKGLSLTFSLPGLSGGEYVSGIRLIAAFGDSEVSGSEVTPLKLLEGSASLTTNDVRTLGSCYRHDSLREVYDYAEKMEVLASDMGKIDLLHAHDWLTFPAAMRIKRRLDCPMIAHVHSTEYERAGGRVNPVLLDIEYRGLLEADRILAVSSQTRQILIDKYAIASAKVDIAHNAADHQPLRPANLVNCPRLVSFIGRVTWQKGPSDFIRAACRVASQLPDVRFVMAGEGDRLEMMKAMASALGIANRVHFPGFLDASGVQKLLERTTVYVMPSLLEPFGIGALEAIRCGVPVVLSKSCGVNEIVEHVTKVEAGDIDGLAASIVDLITHSEDAIKKASLAQQEVSDWSWKDVSRNVLAIYRSILGDGKRGGAVTNLGSGPPELFKEGLC